MIEALAIFPRGFGYTLDFDTTNVIFGASRRRNRFSVMMLERGHLEH